MSKENKIYVNIYQDNFGVLEFSDYNIKTIACIGKNGSTLNKKEGDGKTPIGEFDLGVAFGIHTEDDFENKLKMKYIQIHENLYWVDDYKSKYYNRLIDATKVNKDWNSAEHLIDYPIQYEYAIEIKVNPENIINKGSAIFLHCIKNNYTEGCIAIDRDMMKRIMELIDNNTKIEIINIP